MRVVLGWRQEVYLVYAYILMDCFKNQGFENDGFENQWFLKEGFMVFDGNCGFLYRDISICIYTYGLL